MKCAYPPCHNLVEQPLTGRKKRYCSEAHKHADFRRRHPEKSLKNQVKALKSRIYLLERFAKDHAPTNYRLARDIAPVSLADMIKSHGIADGGYVEGIVQTGLLKPVNGMLDAEGQEVFYRLCNGQWGWHACERCPHGVIP